MPSSISAGMRDTEEMQEYPALLLVITVIEIRAKVS